MFGHFLRLLYPFFITHASWQWSLESLTVTPLLVYSSHWQHRSECQWSEATYNLSKIYRSMLTVQMLHKYYRRMNYECIFIMHTETCRRIEKVTTGDSHSEEQKGAASCLLLSANSHPYCTIDHFIAEHDQQLQQYFRMMRRMPGLWISDIKATVIRGVAKKPSMRKQRWSSGIRSAKLGGSRQDLTSVRLNACHWLHYLILLLTIFYRQITWVTQPFCREKARRDPLLSFRSRLDHNWNQ